MKTARKTPQPAAKNAPADRWGPDIINFEGRLPEPMAHFLRDVDEKELPSLYAIIGRYRIVRVAINLAQDLHQFASRGPTAAASAAYSFEEYMETVDGVEKDLLGLRRKLNEALAESHIRLPRISRYPAKGGNRHAM